MILNALIHNQNSFVLKDPMTTLNQHSAEVFPIKSWLGQHCLQYCLHPLQRHSMMRLEGDQPSGYEGKWESHTRERGSCVTEVKAGWQSWNRYESQFPCRSAHWLTGVNLTGQWRGVNSSQSIHTDPERCIFTHTTSVNSQTHLCSVARTKSH